MVSILLVVLLQSPPPPQPADLPVSLDRVREGLARPGRIQLPRPRPWAQPLFRVRVEQQMLLQGDAWDDTSLTPPWIQPTRPPVHYEFLAAVTPAEVRSATLHPCCNVLPLVDAVAGFVGRRVQAAKEGRARREVERAMEAAGIRR